MENNIKNISKINLAITENSTSFSGWGIIEQHKNKSSPMYSLSAYGITLWVSELDQD